MIVTRTSIHLHILVIKSYNIIIIYCLYLYLISNLTNNITSLFNKQINNYNQ